MPFSECLSKPGKKKVVENNVWLRISSIPSNNKQCQPAALISEKMPVVLRSAITKPMGQLELRITSTNPSKSPSAVVAQDGWTNQRWSLSLCNWSLSVISAGDIASIQHPGIGVGLLPPGRSCLLANTSNNAFLISLSLIIRCNSCLASSIRSRSAESTTKINPSDPV
jgi:hypothetical protein